MGYSPRKVDQENLMVYGFVRDIRDIPMLTKIFWDGTNKKYDQSTKIGVATNKNGGMIDQQWTMKVKNWVLYFFKQPEGKYTGWATGKWLMAVWDRNLFIMADGTKMSTTARPTKILMRIVSDGYSGLVTWDRFPWMAVANLWETIHRPYKKNNKNKDVKDSPIKVARK